MASKYNRVAHEYEERRPGYPDELFNGLISQTGINRESALLEIGAGTGKATMTWAEKGFDIDCIEREAEMADILRAKCVNLNVSVIVENFEKWQNSPGRKYDLIYSAQAFHWIDEAFKYKKCHNLLNPNGHLGLIWYFSVLDSEEIYDAVNNIFKKYETGYSCFNREDYNDFISGERGKLEDTSFFHSVGERRFQGEKTIQNAEEFIKRFETTSAFASLDGQGGMGISRDLEKTINSMGGEVSSELVYILFTAERA